MVLAYFFLRIPNYQLNRLGTEVAQSQNVSQEVESLESNASFIDQQYFGNMVNKTTYITKRA